MHGKYIFVGLWILLAAQFVFGKEQYLQLVNSRIECNIHYMICSYSITNNNTALNINMTVLKTFEGSLRANVIIRKKLGKKYQNVIHLPNRNLCIIIEEVQNDFMLNTVLGSFLKELGFTSCPINKGSYSLKNFSLTHDKIPSVVPSGFYRAFMEVFQPHNDDVKVFTTVLHTKI